MPRLILMHFACHQSKCRYSSSSDVSMQIMDERSLIKKYQREINELRQELESLRASMLSDQRPLPDLKASPSASEEDLTALRQQVRKRDLCVGAGPV